VGDRLEAEVALEVSVAEGARKVLVLKTYLKMCKRPAY
jgi:hypothetical protein